MRVTLQTIADRVGVSRMTVSNAFSHPDQLSRELRERILTVADELGYCGPDPSARALVRGSTGTVGVLLTGSLQYAFSDDVATGFLGALVEGLTPTALALTLLPTSERDDIVPARDVAMDAALVYSCQTDSPDREWLVRRKLPLVFVDQPPVAGVPSVNIDDRAGARAAAQHLVDLGHRRVAIVTRSVDGSRGIVDDPFANAGSHPQKQRMLGWLDALRDAGVEPTVVHAPLNTEDVAREVARPLFEHEARPTAVLCFSDVVARGVIDAAAEMGLAVPADLSVVGFDDSPSARHRSPTLTTVRQDVVAKGHLAAEALTRAIADARSGTARRAPHTVLPVELVVRDSTAPPRSQVRGRASPRR